MKTKIYQVRRIVYEDRKFEYYDLLTQAQAADVLGILVEGVRSAIDSGKLTVVIDPTAHKQQGRRLVIRQEVEDYKRARRKSS